MLESNLVFTDFFIAISQLPYTLHSKQIKEPKTVETLKSTRPLLALWEPAIMRLDPTGTIFLQSHYNPKYTNKLIPTYNNLLNNYKLEIFFSFSYRLMATQFPPTPVSGP